jgi:hypothetical protein
MERPRRGTKRFRGYRPAPIWWLKLKFRLALGATGAMIIFASYQVAQAIFSGGVHPIRGGPQEIIAWSTSRADFAWNLIAWIALDLFAFAIFWALMAKLKDLNVPSADSRI